MLTSRPRSLADDLRAREDVALVALLRARPDLLSPVPSDLASLAARATTRPSVTRALDALDAFALQVVDVLCETDVRGQLGIADVPIGWERMLIDVCIASRAPEADVRRVVETADRFSPLLANLSPAIKRVHRLRIIHQEAV